MWAGKKRCLEDIAVNKQLAVEHSLEGYQRDKHAALLAKLEGDKAMDKEAEAELNAATAAFKKSFA